ncbi:MAG: glycosyltransferase family 4 protein, partial [Candidatus Aenigmarchaeota archaeon]|nr:glycosyltransferase family 4 protein [Candidatus Aenigmarchaeota archaeon]
MHVLFLTHYFPPEVNAPASRTFENAKRWVNEGHRVTVLTCVPNHPRGIAYPGYQNHLWQWEEQEGIKVLRVMTYLSANEGFLKRTMNYISYMLSATILCFLVKKVDLVVSTSPQFFCGMAGLWVSGLKRRRWVLEIRDLWPESIISVGAIKNRRVIKLLSKLETFLYSRADHIIALTKAFKRHIESRGIPGERISVITNGADFDKFNPLPKRNRLSDELNLNGKFVVSYIGTHGMAHGLDTVLRAAQMLQQQQDITFLLVGDGAERNNLVRQKEVMGLKNVMMLPQQPREKMPEFLALSDVNMVLLRKNDLFKTVIPSKIFESMAMERPIILGVEGESKEIIEEAEAGICIEPESENQLAEAVLKLYNDSALMGKLGKNGR